MNSFNITSCLVALLFSISAHAKTIELNRPSKKSFEKINKLQTAQLKKYVKFSNKYRKRPLVWIERSPFLKAEKQQLKKVVIDKKIKEFPKMRYYRKRIEIIGREKKVVLKHKDLRIYVDNKLFSVRSQDNAMQSLAKSIKLLKDQKYYEPVSKNVSLFDLFFTQAFADSRRVVNPETNLIDADRENVLSQGDRVLSTTIREGLDAGAFNSAGGGSRNSNFQRVSPSQCRHFNLDCAKKRYYIMVDDVAPYATWGAEAVAEGFFDGMEFILMGASQSTGTLRRMVWDGQSWSEARDETIEAHEGWNQNWTDREVETLRRRESRDRENGWIN